jgi:hypothetical protein
MRVLLLLFLLGPGAFGQYEFQGVQRIVAVGDIHGGFDQLTDVLRSAGVIDKRNRWAGGKTHLVQVGDMVNRGPASRRVMDLLMNLEGQARRAGGHVHVLLGNHEAMNLYGDLRYLAPADWAAYRSSESAELRERFWELSVPQAQRADPAFRKQWEAEHPLGWVEHRQAFAPDGRYGKWLRARPVIVKIDGLVFVHAGIGPKYASWTLDRLNDAARAELQDFSRLEDGVVLDDEGPLWYRGLAQAPEEELAGHVDAVLAHLGARHMVIGHTPMREGIQPRFGGKVLLIDTGMTPSYGGRPACLVVEGGRFREVDAQGKSRDLNVPTLPLALGLGAGSPSTAW